MIRSFYTAASGMQAQQLNIDTVANNLANVNTTGFKRVRTEFQDLLYQTLRAPGAASSLSSEYPVGLQLGLGTKAVANDRLFLQGDFKQTGNSLDLVIEGAGFFPVVGNLAYPLQILYSSSGNADLSARFILYDGFCRVGQHLPVWGGRDTLTEHVLNRLPHRLMLFGERIRSGSRP